MNDTAAYIDKIKASRDKAMSERDKNWNKIARLREALGKVELKRNAEIKRNEKLKAELEDVRQQREAVIKEAEALAQEVHRLRNEMADIKHQRAALLDSLDSAQDEVKRRDTVLRFIYNKVNRYRNMSLERCHFVFGLIQDVTAPFKDGN